MRKLKHHEHRLLRKSDLLQWKREAKLREVKVCRKYRLSSPHEYHQYNRIVGAVKSLSQKLQELPQNDEVRVRLTQALLNKLYDNGFISEKTGLSECAKLTVSALCRRRLPVVMMRLRFAENLNEAVNLIEQGHVRVGPNHMRTSGTMITRTMEDFLTWTETSKIRRKVSLFNDTLDDYDLLNV